MARKGTAASLERRLRDFTEQGLERVRLDMRAPKWDLLERMYGTGLDRPALLVVRSKAVGEVRLHCNMLGC